MVQAPIFHVLIADDSKRYYFVTKLALDYT